MTEADDVLLFDQSLNKYLEHEMMTKENSIRQALARGYCHPDNANKELDAKLIEAMTSEVVKALAPKDRICE